MSSAPRGLLRFVRGGEQSPGWYRGQWRRQGQGGELRGKLALYGSRGIEGKAVSPLHFMAAYALSPLLPASRTTSTAALTQRVHR